MRDIPKLFITIALGIIFLGIITAFVAAFDFTQRNVYYRDCGLCTVTKIVDQPQDDIIDTVTGIYKYGEHIREIYLITDDGDTVLLSPAYIPDTLTVGDTVRLYRSHSRGLFDFSGTAKAIKWNGKFLRSWD